DGGRASQATLEGLPPGLTVEPAVAGDAWYEAARLHDHTDPARRRLLQDPPALRVGLHLGDHRVEVAPLRLGIDPLKPDRRGDRLPGGQVGDPSLQHDTVRVGVPVGYEPTVDDLDPLREGHIGPGDVAGVDVDLRRRTGVAGVRRVEVGRELAEAFPA